MGHSLQHIVLSLALALIAAAYAAVGQAGATGYIAALGLAGFPPDVIRPAALALNTLVAAIGTARFARAGHVNWRGTYPFVLLGLSVLGGATHLPPSAYGPVVGVLLIVAAWQMARLARAEKGAETGVGAGRRCGSRSPRAPPSALRLA